MARSIHLTIVTAPLRFGLIGCGRMGLGRYVPILRSFRQGQLAAIADNEPGRLEAVRRLIPNVQSFNDHRELLAEAEVDAVIIATPPYLHASLALNAISAGVHVLVQKPFTTTVAEAEAVVAAAEPGSVKVMASATRRLHPDIIKLRAALESGAIGRPWTAEIIELGAISDSWHSETGFELRRDMGGGALLESAVHFIDLARFLFRADVEIVQCRLLSRRWDDDSVWLLMALENGVVVDVHAGFGPSSEHYLLVTGERGGLRRRNAFASLEPATESTKAYITEPLRYLIDYIRAASWMLNKRRQPGYVSFAEELKRFAQAIIDDDTPSPGVLDGLESIRVVEAAYRSAALNGSPIAVKSTLPK